MESELDLIKKTLNVLYNRVSEMEKEIETLKKKNEEVDDDLEDGGNNGVNTEK